VSCAACRSSEAQFAGLSFLLRAAYLEQPESRVVVSRCRLPAIRRLQLGAAAVAVLAGAGLVAARAAPHGREALPSSPDATSAARPAYLDSTDYEQHLIAAVRALHAAARTDGVAPQ
jgi:hypothetical protein